MPSNKPWTVLVIIITVIAIGGMVAWSMRRNPGLDEIDLTPRPPVGSIAGEVYVGGAVGCPGYYALQMDDDLWGLIRAAGGLTVADASQVELRVVCAAESSEAQKVNINRAEAWLLQALPGIGEERAQAIVDYRAEAGRFDSIYDLLEVAGIGTGTLAEISPLITVSD